MSASLARSKQQKSKRNLKNLTISSPIQDYTPPSPFNTHYSQQLSNFGVVLDNEEVPSPTDSEKLKSPIKSGFLSPVKSKKPSKKFNKKSPVLISAPFNTSPSFYNPYPSPQMSSSEGLDNFDNYESLETHTPTTKGVVILVAQYAFNAENPEELSIRPKDYLRLLDRPGDGWLYVKKISNNRSGLIPASYVKIQVNDLVNPVTLDWLNQTTPAEEETPSSDPQDMFDFEIMGTKTPSPKSSPLPKIRTTKIARSSSQQSIGRASHSSSVPSSPGVRLADGSTIKNATVSQVLTDQDRYWYRIDVKMKNSEVYLLKGYHDFYNLNYKLSLLKYDNLPNMPQPFKNSNPKDKKYLEDVLVRCNDLNVYLNRVIKLDYYRNSDELMEFFNSPDKVVNPKDTSNEYINDLLMPGSINLIDLLHPTHDSSKKNFVPTAPLPIVESESTNSFSSLIDSYDQNPERPSGKQHQSTRSTSSEDSSNYAYSSNSKRDDTDSVFSKTSPVTPEAHHGEFPNDILTPITPITPPTSDISQFKAPGHDNVIASHVLNEFVKIKVLLNNKENDIVVIKVRNTNIESMLDIKRLVSYKIYKDIELVNHYRLILPDRQMSEAELVSYIKTSPKVCLTLVRSRGSM